MPLSIKELREENSVFTSDYKIITYGSNQAHDLINSQFPSDVYLAYKKLIPDTYKADLLKYCILYKQGGWIIDPTLKILGPLPSVKDKDLFIFFRKAKNGNFTIPVPGLIYAKPENRFFLDAIKRIVSNTRHSFYGATPWDPTGSELLAKILPKYYSSLNIGKGLFMPVTKLFSNQNLMYLDMNGNLIAWHKSGRSRGKLPVGDCGELNEFGVNYLKAWNSRTIYQK